LNWLHDQCRNCLTVERGIGPRDLISILQAIKAAGAIQADIEVM